MKDKNGIELKVGDWVKIDPFRDLNKITIWYGKITEIKPPSENYKSSAYVDVRNYKPSYGNLYDRNSQEIEKLSDEEAMIYILERQ